MRLELQAPAAASATGELPFQRLSNVPPVNRYFVGRRELLDRLRLELLRGNRVVVQALVGLGGIGKTQLAFRYAHEYADEYSLIWTVRSETENTLLSDLATLGKRLAVATDATPSTDAAHALVAHLGSVAFAWLLIFDNAADPGLLAEYIPAGQGHVLITSRMPHWRSFAVALEGDVLPRSESVQLLRLHDTSASDRDLTTVAEALGDLPLALEQARAYMERTATNVANLAVVVRDQLERILGEAPLTNYPASVATTWALSMADAKRVPLAADLLSACSYVAPERIPRHVIRAALVCRTGGEGVLGTTAVDDAIGTLRSLSLIAADSTSISVHRLVQMVTRTNDSEAHATPIITGLVAALNAAFRFDERDLDTWSDSHVLVAHILAVCQIAAERHIEDAAAGRLLARAALFLSLQAEFDAARGASEAALAIQERLWGETSHLLLPALNTLGDLLGTSGDYERSRTVLERGRDIVNASIASGAIAPSDPDATTNLNLLGELSYEQDDFMNADVFLKGALALRLSNDRTPLYQVATSLNNVAKLFERVGDFAEAEHLYNQSLAIRRRELKADHPHVATSLSNLGILAERLGRIDEAVLYQRAALDARARWLGNRHPHVLKSRKWVDDLETKRDGIEGEAT